MSRRSLRTALTTAATVAVVSTMIAVLPAAANPDTTPSTPAGSSAVAAVPTNASEAKTAWLDAASKAEAANEALLNAQVTQKKAEDAAAAAQVALTTANLNASTAQAASVQADANYAAFRSDLAQFASASFRGARLGQLSALLTAESTSDYLDEMSSLDQVAGSTRALMEQAFAAKDAATTAAQAATEAQDNATTAAATANQAVEAAQQATDTVTAQKTALDNQVDVYHRLFDALNGQERDAAMQAQQAAWEQQSEAAAAAQGAGNQIVQQAGGNTSTETSGTDQAIDTATPQAQIAIKAALSKLGAPYVYGATGPNAFDCSGLTSWAWAQAGVTLPRTSSAQAALPVVPLDQLRPGDLITYYSPVHHVALYIGNGQIIHASTEGVPVYITSMYRGGPYPVGHRVDY